MIEDNPPNVPSEPVFDELLRDRDTDPAPAEPVDNRMVQLALSSMATTLESIERSIASVPPLLRSVRVLERQHEATLRAIGEAKGAANLAGSMAARALDDTEAIRASCERIEVAVGKLARSMQGLDERSRSTYDAVFPERDSPSAPPDIELADVVPIYRRVMTGE